jgi:hypothetical protein
MYGGDSSGRNRSEYSGTQYLTLKYMYPWSVTEQLEVVSPIIGPEGNIYVLFEKPTKLIAYKDGAELWSYLGTGMGNQHGSPTLDSDGNIYFVDWNTTDSVAQFISLTSTGQLRFKRSTNTHGFSATHNQLGDLMTFKGDIIVGPHGYSGVYQAVTKNNVWWKDRSTPGDGWQGSLPGYNWVEYGSATEDEEGNSYYVNISGLRKLKLQNSTQDYADLWVSLHGGRGVALPSDDNNTVYFFENPTGTLYALDSDTGNTIWSLPGLANGNPWVNGNLISLTHSGNIFVTNDFNFTWSDFRGHLVDKNGHLLWTIDKGFIGQPLISAKNGYLYGNLQGSFAAVKETDGSVVWDFGQIYWSNYTGFAMLKNGRAVAMNQFNKIFEFQPWTITPALNSSAYKSGDTITITVTSSMLKTDPSSSEDNQVQAVMENGDKVPLQYISSLNNVTTWQGTYVLPINTTSGTKNMTIEASAYTVKTDIPTHFTSAPTASNNSGIISNISFNVDNTLPTGSISINSGSTHTNTSLVNLSIEGNDDSSGVSSVMLSEDSNFTTSSWEPFSTSKTFNLSSGDRSKKIYMKLKDNASNISSIYDDTIILDTIPPAPLNIKKIGDISIKSDSGSLVFYYLGKDVVISGTGVAGNTAYFKFGDKIFNTLIDSIGKFSINLDIVLLSGVNKIEYYQKEPSGSNSSTSSLTLITDCIKNFPERLQEVFCPTSSTSSSSSSDTPVIEKSTSSISKTDISDLLLKDNEKITIKILFSDNKLFINTDVIINEVSYKTDSNGEVVIPKVKGKYIVQYKTSNGEVLGNFSIDQDQSAITVVLSEKTKSPIISSQNGIIIFMIGFIVLVLLIITIYFKKKKNNSSNL